MSQTASTPVEQIDPAEYADPDDDQRYVRFAEEVLGLTVTAPQRRVLVALAKHERVHVESGNGVGKSFIAAVANLAFLFGNPDSTNMATSGTYSVLSDVLWKPMRSLFKHAQREYGLPGRCLENPPRLLVDDEWYFKAVSPTHPDNLEGRHAGTMLVTIEEVDKPDITADHFDSAGSMLTDSSDRFLAISNPPRDETNVAYDLAQSDRWHTIRFSSFESHNVQVDAGEIAGEKIPGLVDLETIRDDWEAWNREEWPGYETARNSDARDDLDTRWYRRRLGVMPPDAASAHRPFSVADVEAAFERDFETRTDAPEGLALDVARAGGDSNVFAAKWGDVLDLEAPWSGVDHNENEARVRQLIERRWTAPFAVDAQGEGSGLADRVKQFYPQLRRFNAGGDAFAKREYKDNWSEGLAYLGQFLRNGGSFSSRRLREELLAAARVVEFEERYYSSRNTAVLKATSKDAVKDQLGRSPDALDAAYMAVWAARNSDNVGSVKRRTPASAGKR